MIYNTFDIILKGYEADTTDDAIAFARGMVWNEIETSEQSIAYARYIDSVDGIGIYYDYGADYYFFTDETTGVTEMDITAENFPKAFAAMDECASGFWAYPDEKWQLEFLKAWAWSENDDRLLEALLVFENLSEDSDNEKNI